MLLHLEVGDMVVDVNAANEVTVSDGIGPMAQSKTHKAAHESEACQIAAEFLNPDGTGPLVEKYFPDFQG